MDLTRKRMDDLIDIAKRIVEPVPRSWTEERGHRRRTFRAESIDRKASFRIFARVNERFQENFTIGLAWQTPEGGEIVLLRCNGPHGIHRNQGFPPDDPHYGCHVHRVRPEDAAIGLTVERDAEKTSEYSSFEEAVLWLGKTASIAGLGDRFGIARHEQWQLFSETP